MFTLSGLLLVFGSQVARVVQPMLVVFSILGFIAGIGVRCYQTIGNRELRLSQIRDAFGIAIGDQPRDGYYNNPQGRSLRRLALTTLENTKFTIAVLDAMLFWKRIFGALYLIVFLLLLAFRQTSLDVLVIAVQSVFSGEVVFDWWAMERYRFRTRSAREQLRRYFATANGITTESHAEAAIFLSAFADYECAKDEAAIPLDSGIFAKVNPATSEEWQREIADLGITPQSAAD